MEQRVFTASYEKRGKWVLGWVEEIPGVNTQGRTLREARSNLKEALTLVLEVRKELLHRESGLVNARREAIKVAVPA